MNIGVVEYRAFGQICYINKCLYFEPENWNIIRGTCYLFIYLFIYNKFKGTILLHNFSEFDA